MRRFGKDRYGRQRWQCCLCGRTFIYNRPDHRERAAAQLISQWLTSSQSLAHFAHTRHVSLSTVRRRLQRAWQSCPLPAPYPHPVRVMVVDALSVVKHQCVVMIARNAIQGKVIRWRFAPRESYLSWERFLSQLPKPQVVVCDGQKCLLKAISEHFPNALIQRCMIHVIRQANIWLTQRPKTRAGIELRGLVRLLPGIQTRRQKRRWVRAFRYWRRHSSPDLFRFVKDRTVPKTSNHVEGGINSRMKDLFRRHRGIKGWKKIILAGYYLRLRQR